MENIVLEYSSTAIIKVPRTGMQCIKINTFPDHNRRTISLCHYNAMTQYVIANKSVELYCCVDE